MKIVTCAVDAGLNDQKFIVPGLGRTSATVILARSGTMRGLWGCD